MLAAAPLTGGVLLTGPLLSPIVLGAFAIFLIGYLYYSRRVAGPYELDDHRQTPASSVNDGVDFVPTPWPVLLAQHFAAISAAGPVVGPILAGTGFGWGPALIWVVVGAVFIGAVHDFSTLVASVRHKACSIPEVVRQHVGTGAFWILMTFIWLSLMYVLVAFVDVTASQFLVKSIPGSTAHGGSVATSSILYLVLAVAMGFCTEKLKMKIGLATAIFVPLLFASVWVGQYIPLPLGFGLSIPDGRVWAALILVYCAFASVLPMWALLQPRGYLGGLFLYVILIAGVLGMIVGGFHVEAPAFIGFSNAQGMPLFPFLFVTIACGACSGFHGLVASGTTSKQVACESHTRHVGYGAMILEGVIAVTALATIMIVAKAPGDPTVAFAGGLAQFFGALGIDPGFGAAFGMLAFATFVFDTIDVATRMGRYLLDELLGFAGKRRVLGTLLTLAIPALYLVFVPEAHDDAGKPIPAWRVIWIVFGASNQLLAALSLTAIVAWLAAEGRSYRYLLLPTGFMLIVTAWALGTMAIPALSFLGSGGPMTIKIINGFVAAGLLVLGIVFIALVVRSGLEKRRVRMAAM